MSLLSRRALPLGWLNYSTGRAGSSPLRLYGAWTLRAPRPHWHSVGCFPIGCGFPRLLAAVPVHPTEPARYSRRLAALCHLGIGIRCTPLFDWPLPLGAPGRHDFAFDGARSSFVCPPFSGLTLCVTALARHLLSSLADVSAAVPLPAAVLPRWPRRSRSVGVSLAACLSFLCCSFGWLGFVRAW